MVVITACECFDRPPHTHVPEKALVRLDDGAHVLVDAAHFEMNKGRISGVVEIDPPRIEWWKSPDGDLVQPD